MHALLAILLAQAPAALPPDSVEALRREARRAEARFEREARRLAPLTWSAPGGSSCDEIVGRFCLSFDGSPSDAPAGEPGRVIDARRDAVEAARRYFSAAPAERAAAGPLVRLLIADDRTREAVSAASAFAALSRDSLWGPLLLGLAQHAAGDAAPAAANLDLALARLPDAERRRWLDIQWLLEDGEYRRYRRMSDAERAEYERRFWLLADPFWVTPENEFFAEHITRHAQAKLLAEVPLVSGMVRWADDLTQLTVRYGVPTARRRTAPTLTQQSSQIEYWDSAQRAFAPRRLTEGVPPPPLPGDDPLLYFERARTTYAPRGIERVLELPHQVTRFLRRGEILLRVDARAAELPAGRRTTALVAYDSALTRRSVRQRADSADSGAAAVLFANVAPGALVYSAEVLVEHDSSTTAARARYALGAFIPESGPVLSDPLLARPFGPRLPRSAEDPELRGVADLVVAEGDTIGVFLEAYRVDPGGLTVEVSMEPADRPSLLRQLGGWLGRTLGVSRPRVDPRIAWQEEHEDGRYVIALDLPLERGRRGMHELVIRITTTQGAAEARRRFHIR